MILRNGSIDTIYEILLFSLFALALFLLMFRFMSWFERLKPKEKKVKEKKVKSQETIKAITVEEELDSSKLVNNDKIKEDSQKVIVVDKKEVGNYLYDRFVESPSKEDSPQVKKTFNNFLTDEEFKNIRDNKVEIHVKQVETLSGDSRRNYLYNRIEEMATQNIDRKEKLLQEFDKLPREIKLMLIENIMQNY